MSGSQNQNSNNIFQSDGDKRGGEGVWLVREKKIADFRSEEIEINARGGLDVFEGNALAEVSGTRSEDLGEGRNASITAYAGAIAGSDTEGYVGGIVGGNRIENNITIGGIIGAESNTDGEITAFGTGFVRYDEPVCEPGQISSVGAGVSIGESKGNPSVEIGAFGDIVVSESSRGVTGVFGEASGILGDPISDTKAQFGMSYEFNEKSSPCYKNICLEKVKVSMCYNSSGASTIDGSIRAGSSRPGAGVCFEVKVGL